ncbi:L-threonylcarbamoyladenylate synthase [Aliibacillus thermotolerans]|uniref:Threonylcarbamoyl-AMP synthase n=1 Tax=Aliibacillus thermotolerans TaxID=1834418 RepID=A0ABW0U3T7_9BACI|nr:L-threonylcarbamoyladenylate synthase [Aliibacillus thermotolerans]MDA3129381.1 threonylcarbamoyl-AMP synthase [Aliibacillus thermotolerans]
MSYSQTKIWVVDKNRSELEKEPAIQEAALWINKGEVIAFPTETVYGLGADARNDKAVKKIFQAKGRPGDNPLIVHIGEKEQLHHVTRSLSCCAEQLMERFWPGPLTVILPKKEGLSSRVTAGLDTVAVRMPSHPVARALLQVANVPVAAPSANRSGKPSPTKAAHVMEDLDGKIKGVIDGGDAGYGVESTVIEVIEDIVWILRPGGVTKEQLAEVVGEKRVKETTTSSHAPKSPGMKYRHYAPNTPLLLVDGNVAMQREITKRRHAGQTVTVMAREAMRASSEEANHFVSLGQSLEEVAARLYDQLREADRTDADVILCETFPPDGLGRAIMNRLEKAASG